MRHIEQSNLIEGIRARPGTPHHASHLRAAHIAAQGRMVEPNVLHLALAHGVPRLAEHAGRYRRVGVYIGRNIPGNRMPNWRAVPALMEDWFWLASQFEDLVEGHAGAAQFLHDWLLCIHPYADGNGRTARLVLNMLRVHKGLPWYINRFGSRRSYYARIRAVETQVFREHYKGSKNVY